jgi:hypothetical protein
MTVHKSCPWTPAEDALVRTLPPAAAARATGRPQAGVYHRRCRLGLAAPRCSWTATEDARVRALSPAAAARALGRTLSSVYARQHVFELDSGARRWTPAEDWVVLGRPPRAAHAVLPHRTLRAIYNRRNLLRAQHTGAK